MLPRYCAVIYQLGSIEYGFPPSHLALTEPNGLLAWGGDLHPERLKLAYSKGVFPWFNEGDEILWWTPNPRCVFFPEHVQASSSLYKFLKKNPFRFSVDRAFTDVMRACASPRSYADGTWIQESFIENYTALHQQGIAHSIEVWNGQGQLVGGIYGINLGRVFFGESMFSFETNGSKAAFMYLMQLCRYWQIPVVDAQVENPHLMSLGAQLISRSEFEHLLANNSGLSSPNWREYPDFSVKSCR
jgi:leucyl/phenylalanyl-tRNA--protein transferase